MYLLSRETTIGQGACLHGSLDLDLQAQQCHQGFLQQCDQEELPSRLVVVKDVKAQKPTQSVGTGNKAKGQYIQYCSMYSTLLGSVFFQLGVGPPCYTATEHSTILGSAWIFLNPMSGSFSRFSFRFSISLDTRPSWARKRSMIWIIWGSL